MTDLPSRHERWMLATLAVIQFTATLDFMVMMPLAPQFTRLFGISAQEFGFLISAYTFAAAGAGVVTSIFIERFDRKRLLLTIYSGFVVSAIVTASAQSYPLLLAARALAGIFGGVLAASCSRSSAMRFRRRGVARDRDRDDFVLDRDRGRCSGRSAARQPVRAGARPSCWWRCSAWRAQWWPVARCRSLRMPAGPASRCMAGFPAHADVPEPSARFPVHVSDDAVRLHVIPYVSLLSRRTSACRSATCRWCTWRVGVATFFTARWIGSLGDRAGKRQVYGCMQWISIDALIAITHGRACRCWRCWR